MIRFTDKLAIITGASMGLGSIKIWLLNLLT